MIVSCSSCATKFHIPDSKVAGKRARMKCKKCKTPIEIDGSCIERDKEELADSHPASSRSHTEPHRLKRETSRPRNEPTTPPPSGLSPRWRVAEPSGRRHEMSLDILAENYASGGFEPGTLVCQPGATQWMPPYDFPEVMAKASPTEESPSPQPTFTDETVALTRAESAALTRQAQPSYPGLLASLGPRPSAQKAEARSIEPPQPPPVPTEEKFFDGSEVQGVMDSFDRLTTGAPPPVSVGPTSRTQSPPSSRAQPSQIAGSVVPPPPRPARPRTIPSVPAPASPGSWPPPSTTLRPSHPAPAPGQRVAAAPPATVPPVTRPSAPPVANAPQGSMQASTPPPGSVRPSKPPSATFQRMGSASARPAPSAHGPSHATALAQSFPQATMPQYAAYGEVSNTRVFDTRPPGPGSTRKRHPSSIPSAPPLRTIASASGRLPGPTTESGLSGVSGLSNLSRIEQRPAGVSGTFVLFLTFVLLAGAVGGIYLFRPALFERGSNAISTLLGDQESPQASSEGPPFDEGAAGTVLGKAAKETSHCKKGDGPIGKGRVRVLYQPDGRAQKVAVSEPFHNTEVGRCLIEHFKGTKVPAFSGQPVIVNKTFELE